MDPSPDKFSNLPYQIDLFGLSYAVFELFQGHLVVRYEALVAYEKRIGRLSFIEVRVRIIFHRKKMTMSVVFKIPLVVRDLISFPYNVQLFFS